MSKHDYRHPNWMSQAEFRKHFEGEHWDASKEAFTCAKCCRHLRQEEMHWDHIVPVEKFRNLSESEQSMKGGEAWLNSAENTQPMCPACNIAKSNYGDSALSKSGFFDQKIDLRKLRSAQLNYVYSPIAEEHAGIFSQPASNFSARLIWCIGDTGCGKTLSMPVIGFAVNRALQDTRGIGIGEKRVVRILVIEKDEPLRDQAAKELRQQLVNFGLVPKAPRVKVFTTSLMANLGEVRDCDIAVACIQSLWNPQGKGGEASSDVIANFLRQFSVNTYDEPHYATEGVQRIMEYARHAWHFGLSASPFDGSGYVRGYNSTAKTHLCVRLTTPFGYDLANINDNSVKGLGRGCLPGSAERDSDVDILAARDPQPGAKESQSQKAARAQAREQLATMFSDVIEYVQSNVSEIDGSDAGVAVDTMSALKILIDRMCEKLVCLDRIRTNGHSGEVSKHRDRTKKYRVTDGFFAHAIVRVDGMVTAALVTAYLNHKFEEDPKRYPAKDGYRAIDVTGPGSSFDDWIRYHEAGLNESAMGQQCARIAVVDQKGREGLNNSACLLEVKGRRIGSLSENYQSDGRSLRSCHGVDPDGTIAVPPAEFDNMCILTHANFWDKSERWILPWSLMCKMNLAYATSEMPSIDTLEDGHSGVDKDIKLTGITRIRKLAIAEAVGKKYLDADRGVLNRKFVAAICRDTQIHPVADDRKINADIMGRLSGVDGGESLDHLNIELGTGFTLDDAAVCSWGVTCAEACEGNTKQQARIRKSLKVAHVLEQRTFSVREDLDISDVSYEDKLEYVCRNALSREVVELFQKNIAEDVFQQGMEMTYATHRERYYESDVVDGRTLSQIAAEMAGSFSASIKNADIAKAREINHEFALQCINISLDEILGRVNSVDHKWNPMTIQAIGRQDDQNGLRDKIFGRFLQLAINKDRLPGLGYCLDGLQSKQRDLLDDRAAG